MGDDHNYYLGKLITDIYETEESEKPSKFKIILYLNFLFPCDRLGNDMILDKF